MAFEIRVTNDVWHDDVAAEECRLVAGPVPKRTMRKPSSTHVKNALSDYVKKAAKDEVLITRDGKPEATFIGSAGEDDWFDYRLEHDERFLKRVEESRGQARSGVFVRLEEPPAK